MFLYKILLVKNVIFWYTNIVKENDIWIIMILWNIILAHFQMDLVCLILMLKT